MALDLNSNNVAYLVGRFYAVVEEWDSETAQSCPVMLYAPLEAFGTLSRYLTRADEDIQAMADEIVSRIPPGSLPRMFSPTEKADACLGHRHQRQHFADLRAVN